ncbi:uncharacterized protein LOC125677565 isoform X2 [Ostrea edulis]|uniref:uncharacterized protein LOC125677565 isoform X2 n=1 Tax=Ostrea edulis TaxID=37623 RepID=UPI0024AFC4D7|nr:uncharacterized protein LOC125677565 isoform X2 [Ostrea edulis]XP_056014926.1 uncharacterized protein LOC125677565 isoform X2 [Ostrea edulis]XP_056014927.1 uncharacterized protein LOC125677565 isoform X2 [Ostrea edulis]XP_056014928.1 uncharacterized protein LOC125677565 isoform X2 [Ostrea edulis]
MILQFLTMMIVASVCLLDVKKYAIGEECIESNLTAEIVQGCPKTSAEWATAASKKACSHIKNNCGSFEYHCVTNAWQNETIEVCSKVINIVGKVCAEYSFGGRRIQRNRDAKCATCPDVYLSNESYKYSECYSQAYQRRKTVKPNIITSSCIYTTNEGKSTTSSTLLVHIQAVPTLESQLAHNINHTNAENQKQEATSENTVLLVVIIPLAIAVFIFCLIFLVCRVCKDRHFCSLKGIFSSLFKTKYESKTPRQTDTNDEDNGEKVEDVGFTEEHPLAVDIRVV